MLKEIKPTTLFILLLLSTVTIDYSLNERHFYLNASFFGVLWVLSIIVSLCKEMWKFADSSISLRRLFQKGPISIYETLIPFIIFLAIFGIFFTSLIGRNGSAINNYLEISWARNFLSFGTLFLWLVAIFLHRLLIVINIDKPHKSDEHSALGPNVTNT